MFALVSTLPTPGVTRPMTPTFTPQTSWIEKGLNASAPSPAFLTFAPSTGKRASEMNFARTSCPKLKSWLPSAMTS
jgi:hypothetical protein